MRSSICKTLHILTLAVGLSGVISPLAQAQLITERDVQMTLEKDGYQQVRDIKLGPEVISAKAVKDGKQVSLMIDPSGKIKEQY